MQQLVRKQHTFWDTGKTLDISFRKQQLTNLKELLKSNEREILDALNADFRKPAFESYGTELMILYKEIDHILSNLKRWAKPKRVSGSIFNFPSYNYIHSQPYGVALIIGAWNYPIQLTLSPVIGAIAAGNCTIIKPSEIAPQTSALIVKLINNNFNPGFLTVVEGDADATQALLVEPLDYIFFTGSSRVGKIIMKAAAEQLTPVTLELGGKSPAIVDSSANLEIAARRICWGKFINAGQTCVSPDYTYVHRSVKDEFCKLLKEQIITFYGNNPQNCPDFARIINQKHFSRLRDLIDDDKLYWGGNTDSNDHYISPTLMRDITWDDTVMQEEIFGPILPILTYDNIQEVISAVNAHPKPLALYLFANNDSLEERVISHIPFGGGCVNDTVAHLGNLELPFGGIGDSGFGSYHGKASFDLFSHSKSIMIKPTWPDIPLRYPPYKNSLKWLRKLSKYL